MKFLKDIFLHFLTKNFIKILFQRLAQTWLEQSLTAMQTEDDDAKKEKRTTVCLKAVMTFEFSRQKSYKYVYNNA